jgi:hypothetical protein
VGRSPEPESGAGEKLRNWTVGNRDDAVREAAAAGLSIACARKITGPRRATRAHDGTYPSARPAVERPPAVNLYRNGVSAEDIAGIIRRHHVLADPARA